MAWIELHQTLPTHRKIKKLRRLLKIKTPQAVGHLVMLWLWSVDNAPDGDLSRADAEDIAEAAEWPKSAEEFVAAMKEAGWIDADMQLHDWKDYTGRLMDQRDEQRRKDRERQARYRAKKAEEANAAEVVSHADVTRDKSVSHALVTALPNSTRQNQLYTPHPPQRAGAGEHDMSHAAQTEEDAVPAMSGAMQAAASAEQPEPGLSPTLGKVMTFYTNRVNPSPSRTSMEELKMFAEEMDADVIIRAMEYALDEHKAAWSYIKATLQAYKAKGIRTLADLQRADDEHERAKQRREDTHNAGTRRNSQGHGAGGTPPASADPLRGFHTEP